MAPKQHRCLQLSDGASVRLHLSNTNELKYLVRKTLQKLHRKSILSF